MTEERYDKLLNVMLEMKGSVEEIKSDIKGLKESVFRLESGQKDLHDSIELLAKRTWHNEKDIYRIKRTMGLE